MSDFHEIFMTANMREGPPPSLMLQSSGMDIYQSPELGAEINFYYLKNSVQFRTFFFDIT